MTSSRVLPADLIRPEIENLPDYNAGIALDRFRARYGIDCVAKLDSNESPLGAAPGAITAIKATADGIARYPDAASLRLRTAIATECGTDAAHVIVGNGSEDLIGALFRSTLRSGDRVVTICPSFGLHEFGALAFGATVTKVAFEEDWTYPVSRLCDALAEKTRVLIFSSPSNPAGPTITEADLRKVLDALTTKHWSFLTRPILNMSMQTTALMLCPFLLKRRSLGLRCAHSQRPMAWRVLASDMVSPAILPS